MASDIEDNAGESTPWYASFWKFCAAYLNDRFGAAWCLSPEQSLSYLAPAFRSTEVGWRNNVLLPRPASPRFGSEVHFGLSAFGSMHEKLAASLESPVPL